MSFGTSGASLRNEISSPRDELLTLDQVRSQTELISYHSQVHIGFLGPLSLCHEMGPSPP